MTKILFIHGLASSGAYKTADTLRILFKPCEVVAPDVPIEPFEALKMLQNICKELNPDLIVGLSLGGFWAQKLRGYRKILINPDFHVSSLLRTMKGQVKYMSPRRNGAEFFIISNEICDSYEQIEVSEFAGLTSEERSITRGMFALNDEIVHCYDEFEVHYPGCGTAYPGKHLPTFPELKKFLLPIARELGISSQN